MQTSTPRMHELFRRTAHRVSTAAGGAGAFVVAVVVVLGWLASGPLFHFSDTWQLVINTGTTIITFLMVFLIQNTQNRDSHALHLKLDELIAVNAEARNKLLGLEDLSDREMGVLQAEFEQLRDRDSRRADGDRGNMPR